MKTIFFVTLITVLAHAQFNLPPPLFRAMGEVHSAASKSQVRNLFMFNYAYYAYGFCKNQDCTPQKIKSEMDLAQQKMGKDFPQHLKTATAYKNAITYLQTRFPAGDLATISSYRTAADIARAGIYTTCVDYSKAVLEKAIKYGYPLQQIGFYVTMIKPDYLKMCPRRDGRPPLLPRPIVHTLVSFWSQGQWHVLNVENPRIDVVTIGSKLPNRLGREHMFTYPPLVANQQLIYAGTYDSRLFVNGYPLNWLISITASGKLEADITKVRCE